MFGKLKGLIFEEDPNAPKPAAGVQPVMPQTQGQPAAAPIGTASMVYAAPGVNQDMVNAIKKAVFSRSTPFTTLMNSAEKLASFIPNASQRLAAAFATNQDGRTPQQIVSAVDIHLMDVDGEEKKFAGALAASSQQSVGANQQRVAAMKAESESATAQIASFQAQIAALQGKIQQNATDIVVIEAEIATKTAELQQAEVEFKAAADFVRGELNANKQAIMNSLA